MTTFASKVQTGVNCSEGYFKNQTRKHGLKIPYSVDTLTNQPILDIQFEDFVGAVADIVGGRGA